MSAASSGTTVAVRLTSTEERAKSDLGKGPAVNVISESGLYKLVLRSDKAVAKDFQPLALRTG
ncbi:BRO family protein [Rhizobium giardinii]|uniref:BRO family protein n=1 Tax=Rhizobium giardinii TaxID=56731 RepID=UPI002285A519|nr:BRO family protein [Rhizobium giardinii]